MVAVAPKGAGRAGMLTGSWAGTVVCAGAKDGEGIAVGAGDGIGVMIGVGTGDGVGNGDVVGEVTAVGIGVAVGDGNMWGMCGTCGTVGTVVGIAVPGTAWSASTNTDAQLNSVKRTIQTQSASNAFLPLIMPPKWAAHEDLVYAAHFKRQFDSYQLKSC